MARISRRAMLIGGGVVGAGLLGAAGLAGRRIWLDREPEALPLQDDKARLLWQNWSGTEYAYPATRAAPRSEDELVALLRTATAPIRPVGSGHSFTGLVPTPGTLLTLDGLSGLVGHDAATSRAVVRGGTRLGALGPALSAIGQEMSNLPDINKQSLAGALATGTHGTGRGIRALHGDVVALRLATPSGDLIDCDATTHPELFNAARVGLGAFGVVTQVTLQNRPLTRVLKRTWLLPTEEVLARWPALRQQHRNVEFLVLPFTGYAVVITHDETDRPIKPRGPDRDTETLMGLKRLRDIFEFASPLRIAAAKEALKDIPPEEMVDDGWKLLSNERPVRFKEIEYHLPIDAQIPALREILEVIETRRPDVFFPIEARVIAPDDAWLSPFNGRETGSIAVHAWYKDDHDFFFSLIEPIFRRYEGRPHWGKLHSLKARDFAALYPNWREAQEVRRALDPEGRMLNDYLKRILVDEA
ncbi:D-arabinono-1,4-lactone oxidase [Sphingomonas sp. LaA6.9]|uniref:D-arabinono-1,4-lactone oxidase n=1 Tax=Sphingomonas sp. LaA6.9 TaxID=2919914 RepID=UPI001F50033D|nr:D-arabinono-1,4-lactone oxidase [Sphingomonas sp. LaA6.9]MCJ8157963.1 FAD-binding protein [Sphingomonas sp. LaA6.9]